MELANGCASEVPTIATSKTSARSSVVVFPELSVASPHICLKFVINFHESKEVRLVDIDTSGFASRNRFEPRTFLIDSQSNLS